VIIKKYPNRKGVNPEAWICPFSVSTPQFSGFQIETRFSDTIWSIYPNHIPTQEGDSGSQDLPFFISKLPFIIDSI
jgi:hypothetical protein